jgi:hypothetical protein
MWALLHLKLYKVPHCDFHRIDGNLLLVLLEHWIDLEGYILMEPLLFMASDRLMEVFGWGSLTSPWLDNCACCLVVFSHVLALLITPWLVCSQPEVLKKNQFLYVANPLHCVCRLFLRPSLKDYVFK